MHRTSRLRSIRARTTIAASTIVFASLLLVAIATTFVLRRTLENSISATARSKSTEVVAALRSGIPPSEVVIPEDDDTVLQISDGAGTVIVSNVPPEVRDALPQLRPGESGRFEVPLLDDDPFIYVAREAMADSERFHILVGRNGDLAVEAVSTSIRIAALAFPLLLLIVGWLTWRLTGRALAPVERLRQEVEAIQGSAGVRLEVPDTSDEISRLAATMNGLLARLEKAQQQQRRFVSDASHELKNPIAAIRQHAEVALTHPEATDVGQLAEDVLAEDLRLQQIAEDLLFLARVDEGALDLGLEQLDLDDVVFEEVERLKRTAVSDIDTSAVSGARIQGHRGSIQRAIRNIGENASRHARGKIAFSLMSDNGRVVLRVDDDGPGIPVEARHEVFHRFTRLDAARARDHGGVGLGLAIVAEVVSLHHGSVKAESSPLGGARIELSFPAAS